MNKIRELFSTLKLSLKRFGRNTLIPNLPDLLALFGVVVGWVLVTLAAAHYVPAGFIWPLSIGILIFGLTGFRFLARLVVNGLYLPWAEDRSEDT